MNLRQYVESIEEFDGYKTEVESTLIIPDPNRIAVYFKESKKLREDRPEMAGPRAYIPLGVGSFFHDIDLSNAFNSQITLGAKNLNAADRIPNYGDIFRLRRALKTFYLRPIHPIDIQKFDASSSKVIKFMDLTRFVAKCAMGEFYSEVWVRYRRVNFIAILSEFPTPDERPIMDIRSLLRQI